MANHMIRTRDGFEHIITSHIFPPIPDRRYDWCAYLESADGLGNCGYGRTEDEAIDDLLMLLEAE